MLLFLLSCSGKGDDSQKPAVDDSDSRGPLVDDSGDDSATHPCGVDIEPIRPLAGDDEAYYRADIEYLLSEPDKKAVVGLRTDPDGKAEGDPIAGKQWKSIDERIVYFTPDVPLATNTDYRSEIDWCGGRQTIPFHTSKIGTPVTAPKELVGTVWKLDMGEGRWIEPRAAMGGIITNYLQSPILVSVELVTDDWIQIEGARALESGMQDVCAATADFSAANFTENPYFSAGPNTLTFVVANVKLVLEDVVIEGSFTSDGSGFEWAEVSGVFDSRPLDETLKGKDSLGAACEAAALAGSQCIPCASDGKPYCLALHVDEISATFSGATVRSIAEDCSDPECKSAECAKKWK